MWFNKELLTHTANFVSLEPGPFVGGELEKRLKITRRRHTSSHCANNCGEWIDQAKSFLKVLNLVA